MVAQNAHLRREAEIIQPLSIYHKISSPPSLKIHHYAVDFNDVLDYLSMLTGSTLSYNLLSFFVRAEDSIYSDDFSAERYKSFEKEFLAATDAYPTLSKLEYSGLFGGSGMNLHPQLAIHDDHHTYLPGFLDLGAQKIRQRFLRSIPVAPILPSYNNRKNISYESMAMYCDTQQIPISSDITTLDLLKLYESTGDIVSGRMELRQAWFYNDLKPRTYYCNGGDSYFASLYIQPVANILATFLPSTDPSSRFDVSRVGPISEDHILITYDYTSFSSSLSELKTFLFHLGTFLRGITIPVLDVRNGVSDIDLGVLLLEYNSFANEYLCFTVNRFDDKNFKSYRMGQAGPLGINGNIVLSTVCHGFSLADLTGHVDKDCCVGDDALTLIFRLSVALFVSCVNNLGSINLDKFSVIKHPSKDPLLSTSFKFLKRPLGIVGDYPSLGDLDFFPDFCSVLYPEGDGFHTLPPGTTFLIRCKSFVMQLCRYTLVTESRSTLPLDEIYRDEDERIIDLFRKCYDALGLPHCGAAPGFRVYNPDDNAYDVLQIFIPPIDGPQLLRDGWISAVYNRFAGQLIQWPLSGLSIPPPDDPYLGQVFTCSNDHEGIRLLDALGHISTELLFEDVWFDYAFRCKLERLALGKEEKPAYLSCTMISKPKWYYDIFSHLYTYDYVEIDEALSIMSSVFSN